MRYSPQLYANSLYDVLAKAKSAEHGGVYKNFWRIVAKNGDISRANTIIDAFEALLVRNTGGNIVTIETARDLGAGLEKELSHLFKKEDVVKKKLNSRLVAGVRIEFNGERELDLSLTTKFRKLFGSKR